MTKTRVSALTLILTGLMLAGSAFPANFGGRVAHRHAAVVAVRQDVDRGDGLVPFSPPLAVIALANRHDRNRAGRLLLLALALVVTATALAVRRLDPRTRAIPFRESISLPLCLRAPPVTPRLILR